MFKHSLFLHLPVTLQEQYSQEEIMTEGPSKNADSVARFLELLARDIANFPQRIASVNLDQAARIHTLVQGVISDPGASLGEEDLLYEETSD